MLPLLTWCLAGPGASGFSTAAEFSILHFENNDEGTKRGHTGHDRLCKVRLIFDLIIFSHGSGEEGQGQLPPKNMGPLACSSVTLEDPPTPNLGLLQYWEPQNPNPNKKKKILILTLQHSYKYIGSKVNSVLKTWDDLQVQMRYHMTHQQQMWAFEDIEGL